MGPYEEYVAARQRIGELVNDQNAGVWVDTCPGWSVKDVVAHLAGGLGDFLDRRMDLAGNPMWGERQVRERRDWLLQRSLAEWDNNISRAHELFDSLTGQVLVAEVITHEHDIRTALGHAGARDEHGVRTTLHTFLVQLGHKINEAGLPALRVVVDGDEHVVGERTADPPEITLRASAFELMRALAGRRTPAQVQQLDWDGDPAPYLDVFFVFGPADHDIHE